ncbi:ergothioneine biosynthesis protein EgtC [Streptomyces sp. S.PNR 29]|uniref:ergothioneine biosynthesis protein EgtC n=1 Tax=Streptomyces sp. S.PNR 29 TaxID=2973805 RepID=UPI0025AF3BBA|nr:ergothioneine biosynthesis protein EgtC [Streptomyces sp. S.PNR 29]MDN0198749.1 ergothioneine biosynthesis protein EgtC [Streptomyces sp. S.PNR 29]
MCRHLAYVGPEEPLGRLLVEPPHALYRQSWAPRRQRYGTVNADGFGVGWYAEGDPVPARYRRAGPIWADQSFADLARVVRTTALLAAVRDATLAGADAEAAAAPFAAGTWLFSHNGAIAGWPGSLAPLARLLPPEELLSLEARNDSAFVWALVLNRLRGGDASEPQGRAGVGTVSARRPEGLSTVTLSAPAAAPRRRTAQQLAGQALADTVVEVAEASPASRLNLLLTNGETIAATAWGDTLWHLTRPGGGTVVASEPYDDDPRWQEVPDRTLLTASRTDVLLTPLKEPSDDAAPAQCKEPCT